MIDWQFAKALEVDTREAVARWWQDSGRSAAAPIPAGLVEDLQQARLTLDDGLQRRLWGVFSALREPQRSEFMLMIAQLDPWHVLFDMTAHPARPNSVNVEQDGAEESDRDLIAALKERGLRRQRLKPPRFPSEARRRLRDLVRRRRSLAAVLEDDAACLLLRFGAALCDLIESNLGMQAEPDSGEVRAELAELSEADLRRAAEAVVVSSEDRVRLPKPERDASKLALAVVRNDRRGRRGEPEITAFVQTMAEAVERHVGDQLKRTIGRGVRSQGHTDVARPDVQLILDLLACHAPLKTAEAVADLITKEGSSSKRRR